jgi:catechol 2,3-dioxygenase-like lactoylglutathione lyase family enzyme
MEFGAIQSAPRVARLDHLVLTVASIDKTVRFYTSVLGMTEVAFGDGRRALSFGQQRLNLHQAGHEFEPKAARPTPGSADICLIADADAATIAAWLHGRGVSVEEGPVARTGALGPITSFSALMILAALWTSGPTCFGGSSSGSPVCTPTRIRTGPSASDAIACATAVTACDPAANA